jgi:hypothetical protein
MTTGEVIAAIALGVPVLGWFASWLLQSIREQRNAKLQALIDYTQRQLQELYGPLFALCVEGHQAWQECARSLERTPDELIRDLGVADPDAPCRLEQDEIETWLFWVDKAFFPRNDKIQELLTTKAHLIERRRDEPVFPPIYRTFLEHYNNWRMRHLRWQEQKQPYSWGWTVPWPDDFNERVEEAFEMLKTRHESLLIEQRQESWHSVYAKLPDIPLERRTGKT